MLAKLVCSNKTSYEYVNNFDSKVKRFKRGIKGYMTATVVLF